MHHGAALSALNACAAGPDPSRSNVMVDGGAPREVRMMQWMSPNGVRPIAIPVLQARLLSVWTF